MAQVVKVGGHAPQVKFVASAHVNSVGLRVRKRLVLLLQTLEDATVHALRLLPLALDLQEWQVLPLVNPIPYRSLNFQHDRYQNLLNHF